MVEPVKMRQVEQAPIKVLLPPTKPDLPRHKSKAPRRVALALVLSAAAALAYGLYRYEYTPTITSRIIARQDVVQTLVASGQVQTPFRITISAQVSGQVVDVPVNEGQKVKTGDILVKLDDRETAQAVAQAKSAVDQAQAHLAQLQDVAGVLANEIRKQSEANLEQAQRTYDRTSKMAQQGFETKAALDAATAALSVARSQVAAATTQATSDLPGGRDYLLAQTQLDQANAVQKAAEARLTYSTVKSQRNGTLISRNVERGEVVQPTTALMVLAPDGITQLVAQVDELNLGLLQLGEKATVVADAFPGKSFDATVSYINPGVDATRGSLTVKLDVADPVPTFLVQDMTVSVEIEVARHPNAIAVSASDINELNTTKPWVWVLDGATVHKRLITKGIAGDKMVEVTSGLNDGDVVAKAQGAVLTEGQRVSVKANGK